MKKLLTLLTSTAILLSAAIKADTTQTQSTTKTHITVSNLTDKPVTIKLKKAEGKPCKSIPSVLEPRATLDTDIYCRLKYIRVDETKTAMSLDPNKHAMFLIELDESGHDIMITPFINDEPGWHAWYAAVARAKTKLRSKKMAQYQKERDDALAQENERYRAETASWDLDFAASGGIGGTGIDHSESAWAHNSAINQIHETYNKNMAELEAITK